MPQEGHRAKSGVTSLPHEGQPSLNLYPQYGHIENSLAISLLHDGHIGLIIGILDWISVAQALGSVSHISKLLTPVRIVSIGVSSIAPRASPITPPKIVATAKPE